MMTKRTFSLFFSFLFLLSGLLATATTAAAQDPQPTPSDNEVNRVAKQMYCPVCENIPLDVCPTQACAEWRELIRLKLSEGWNDQQIKDFFAQQYGDRVLSEPPRRGLNLLVYALPLAALLVGAVIVWRVLANMRRGVVLPAVGPSEKPQAANTGPSAQGAGPKGAGAQGAKNAGAQGDDPYLARLEEELRKKD